jgi:hypothetical protein
MQGSRQAFERNLECFLFCSRRSCRSLKRVKSDVNPWLQSKKPFEVVSSDLTIGLGAPILSLGLTTEGDTRKGQEEGKVDIA